MTWPAGIPRTLPDGTPNRILASSEEAWASKHHRDGKHVRPKRDCPLCGLDDDTGAGTNLEALLQMSARSIADSRRRLDLARRR